MNIKKIKWVNTQYLTYGYIGKLHLFTIGYGGDKEGYFVSSTLEGVKGKVYSLDTEMCKRRADKILSNWLSLIVEE